MEALRRCSSADEYGLGYRQSVLPLLAPQSPPAPRLSTIQVISNGFLETASLPSDYVIPNAIDISSADQVDVDIHLASQLAMNSLARGRLLRQRNIPTISVDSEASDVQTSNPVTRRVSFSSLASRAGSFSLSQSSHMYDNVDNYWENDTTATVENNEYITSKIHQLVCAFADRAQYLKERISQPLSPSTGSPSKGSPEPPPLERSISLLSCSDAGNKDGVLFLSGNWKLPATFHPQSLLYIGWLFLVTLVFIYNLWSIPLRASFSYQNNGNVYQWMVVDYCFDCIYLLDTFMVRPRLRFVQQGIWVEDVSETIRNYVRSFGFKLDILSLLPLDFLYFYFGLNTPLLRIPRMIRILHFWELFDRLDMIFPYPFMVRITRSLFYMLYLMHLNACAYYILSTIEGVASTAFVYQGTGNAYLRSFYFAFRTVTKIGKTSKPVNELEQTFMIFNWIIGIFAFAALIGQIQDIIKASEKSEKEYRDKLDRTNQVMNRLNLPAYIQNRVRTWFTYSWSLQKNLDETSSLKVLPRKLQMDMALYVHIQTLSKVQLFHDCDKALLRVLVLKLKPVLFLPGDLVCKKDEVGKEMYIVKTGQVQVMGGADNQTVLVNLHEGSVFGEISLLGIDGANKRMADVRSKGFSNLFVLSKADLNEALEEYPEAQKILQRKARELIKKTVKRNASAHAQSEPIIVERPSTPKFVKTVLQAIPPSLKASQLLRYGSRSLNHEDKNKSDISPATANESASLEAGDVFYSHSRVEPIDHVISGESVSVPVSDQSDI